MLRDYGKLCELRALCSVSLQLTNVPGNQGKLTPFGPGLGAIVPLGAKGVKKFARCVRIPGGSY